MSLLFFHGSTDAFAIDKGFDRKSANATSGFQDSTVFFLAPYSSISESPFSSTFFSKYTNGRKRLFISTIHISSYLNFEKALPENPKLPCPPQKNIHKVEIHQYYSKTDDLVKITPEKLIIVHQYNTAKNTAHQLFF
jgi:hypothetical protein